MAAKDAVYTALRQRADAEAAEQAARKRAALDWVCAPLEPAQLQLVRSLLASLRERLDELASTAGAAA